MQDEAFQSLSTAEVPPPARLRRWNEFGSETLSDITVDPADRDQFRARLSRVKIGSLGLGWMTTTPAKCSSGAGRVGSWAAPTADAFLLNVQEAGSCTGLHMGHDSSCGPGDLVLLDATRSWTTEAPAPMQMTIVKLPAEKVMKVLGDPEAVCGVRLGGEIPKVALAASMLLSMKKAVLTEPDGEWDGPYEDLVLDVLAILFGDAGPSPGFGHKNGSLRREACIFVERRLDDPDLGVASIAEALGTSTRSIQRLFMEVGLTPRQYILDRRLNAAAERLRRAGSGGGASITDIAYAVGFNDLSYFTRTFRKKLGVSPRQYRSNRAPAH